jgi:cysteine protease ATG4
MLGLNMFIPQQYIKHLVKLSQIPHFRGLLGGRPHSSFYFVGCSQETLFYLDPHITQPYIDLSTPTAPLNSYKVSHLLRLPLSQLDPCLGIAFYCDSPQELHTLQQHLQQAANDISEDDRIIHHITSESQQQNILRNDEVEITTFDVDEE